MSINIFQTILKSIHISLDSSDYFPPIPAECEKYLELLSAYSAKSLG